MPQASSKPPRRFNSPPDRALLSAGIAVLGILIFSEVESRHLRVANFSEPITVDAIVVDAYRRPRAGQLRCQPLFRYEVNGSVWTTQLPFANPQSCYADGSTVPITVDSADPNRIADAASERYAKQSRYGSLVMVMIMVVSGSLLRWRKWSRQR